MKIIITEEQLQKILKIKSTLNEAALASPLGNVNVKISSGYGPRWGRKHHGADLSVQSGTKLIVPADGEVIDAKRRMNACGGTLYIDHGNGLKTRYCHLKRIDVNKGDRVTKGQVAGLTGGAKGDRGRGTSTGAHLHYEVYLNGKTVDPKPYLDGADIIDNLAPDEHGKNTQVPQGSITLYDGMGKGRRGMKPQVKEMQQDLITLNYVLPRFGVDGKFGSETLKAVNAFQSDYGFEETDTVGEETLKAMKNTENINKNPEINDPKAIRRQAREGNIKPFDPAVIDAINKASDEYGLSKELMFTIANIESGGNPTARNKKSGASGLYQILPKYFGDPYTVSNTTVWDPYENANAAAKELNKKIKSLTRVLGQTPTNPQIYMSHNQGNQGFKVIYTACEKFGSLDGKESLQQAANSLGYSRRTGSKIYRNMRGNKGNHPCQFMDSWVDIYNSKKTSYA